MFLFTYLYITLHILLFSKVLAQNTQNVTACLDGKKRITNFEADCKVTGTGITSRMIAVRNLYYGSKPTSANCVSNPRTECCSFNTTTDCIYKKDQYLSHVVRYCTGSTECSVHADHLTQFNQKCSYSNLFPQTSFYGIMEYDCIDTQKLVSICHRGIVKRKNKIYLNSNTFHDNEDKVNTTCSCRVSTICNKKIHVNAINVKLERKYDDRTLCYEELKIADGSDNSTRTVNCSDRQLHGFVPLFTSSSNTLNIDLTTQEKHNGIVWLEIIGDKQDSELEVHCGVALDLSIDNDYRCPKDIPVSVSSPPQILSTTTGDHENMKIESLKNDHSELSSGVIIGVTIAVIFIIIIIVIILLLVFRARKTEEETENNYDYPTADAVQNIGDGYASPYATQNSPSYTYDNPSYTEPVDCFQQPNGTLQQNGADEKKNHCFDFPNDDDDDEDDGILDRKLNSR